MSLICTFLAVAILPCKSFQNGNFMSGDASAKYFSHRKRRSSFGAVAAEPSRNALPSWDRQGSGDGKWSQSKQMHNSSRRRYSREESGDRWRRAEQTEKQLINALEKIRDVRKNKKDHFVDFPAVRTCNAALATFGDNGHLLRALRLFVKMRKIVSFAQYSRKTDNNDVLWRVPAPTLVTYSTLMSRAVQAGKPQVALRLWRLMTSQAEFFSSRKPEESFSSCTSIVVLDPIVPDVKAANTLMNAYAKLADVKSAQDLLEQMVHGNGTDVPRLRPNLVTYNTLLDACHRAGELDHALAAKQRLDDSGLVPDARTYTSLIASVARKASAVSGAYDPTMAFTFLQEMTVRGVRPNEMTYCALIDVCGRCRRSDLALKGLRIMLRQKNKEQQGIRQTSNDATQKQCALVNEVGAWTAAINACGKAARLKTALRLFHAMPNFGVKPNTITCGCLTDCLLRGGHTAEALDVLRYMKREGIVPSEVMYTSLMTSAGRLVQAENKKQWENERKNRNENDQVGDDSSPDEFSIDPGGTKAIEVYTELMTTLMRGSGLVDSAQRRDKRREPRSSLGRNDQVAEDANTLLVKVFLVFQEMKAADAQPDLACYNALMRACARAGDVTRAQDVLKLIRADGLVPNDTTWREMIRAAAKIRRSDLATKIWQAGLQDVGSDARRKQWEPSAVSFGALVSAYLRHASSLDPKKHVESKRKLYEKVVSMYQSAGDYGSAESVMSCSLDKEQLHRCQRTMLLILRAVVSLEQLYARTDFTTNRYPERIRRLQELGRLIVSLACFREEGLPPPLRDGASLNALHRARTWIATER